MFRGFITEVGEILETGGGELGIAAPLACERLEVGGSVGVAGVCLTLIEAEPARSVVELSPETLARTRFGRMRAGAEVNLEPALLAGEPLGGHWVQGHVDGVVELAARRDHSDHSRFTFGFPPAFDPWIVEKGSVAIDGVSLTVAARDASSFDVALIPHTLDVTTLGAVIQPGASIMEIVPLEDTLLIEAQVRPDDIAFIHPGQPATVKVTAYDFSNYGGLPQWPVKFLIPLAFALLFVQGISELIKRIAIINGDLPDDRLDGGHPATARDAGHLELPPDTPAGQKR